MKIRLTHKQIQQLTPFFDRVRATAALGRPGMLVAQIRWQPYGEQYWMEPGFLDHEHALCITEKAEDCSRVPLPTKPAGSRAPRLSESAPDEPAGSAGTVAQAVQQQDSCA